MFGKKQQVIEKLQEEKRELEIKVALAERRIDVLTKELKDRNQIKTHSTSEAKEKAERLQKEIDELQKALVKRQKDLCETKTEHERLSKEIIELRDIKLLQDVGYYEPLYKFSSSSEYADELGRIRNEQKNMIRNGTAATCDAEWMVNNSRREGKKWTNQAIKNALIAFNLECDNVISHVRYYNFESMKARINKCFEKLSKLNSVNSLQISTVYLDLKIQELTLVFEMEMMKEKEKEERRVQKEIQREQAKVEKELEEERRRLEKESIHYSNVIQALKERKSQNTINLDEYEALSEKIEEAEIKLSEIRESIIQVDYRKANQRAGYVYVISNIGAFGDGVYKIGMTRRLDPMDRITELSGASVPFRFDVHALIFSDDAPSLEASLHNTFSNKRVNLVNNRKEFFRVNLSEIEEVVKKNHDKTIEFKQFPEALEYRITDSKLRHQGEGRYDRML